MPLKIDIKLISFCTFFIFLQCGQIVVFANAGSPLIWVSGGHLLIGNLVIGIIEAFVLEKLYDLPYAITTPLLIAGNYVSMIGGMIIIGVAGFRDSTTILNYNYYAILWVIVLVLVTLIIESPFYIYCLKKKDNLLKKAVIAVLIANTASYCIISPFYMLTSITTLFDNLTVEQDCSFAKGASGVIYFISDEDQCVYQCRPDGSELKKVLMQSNIGALGIIDEEGKKVLCLLENQEKRLLVLNEDNPTKITTGSSIQFYGMYGTTIDYRNNVSRNSSVRCLATGIQFTSVSGESINATFESPFAIWSPKCATVLPENFIVYQLGKQICVIDMKNKKIGLLKKGRSPVVVMSDN